VKADPHRAQRGFLVACLFLSGASALVYEVAWMRQLRLTTGATTAAVSTVLAVYMGGLALGASIFGRLADRSRAPLRLYGYLEAAVGVYALLMPSFLSWSQPAYVSLARAAADYPSLLAGLRAALGVLVLLPPTLLMGGTLPVLIRFVGRSEARFGRDLGALYGANLAGAVAGTLAAGFLLVERLGVHGATVAAAIVNLLVGAVCVVRGRAEGPEAAVPAPAETEAAAPALTASRRLLTAVIFFSGFASMGYEVLWTRVLLFTFTSTVQAFAVILATFLAGLALGSGLFALADGRFDRLRTLAAVQSLAGVLSLLFVPLSVRAMAVMQSFADAGRQGEGSVALAMALSAGMVILVPATLMGLVFPLASRMLAGDLARAGQGIGRAYTVNTVGGVLGSLLTGFALIPAVGLKNSLVLLAVSQMALGWVLVPAARFGRGRARLLMAASAAGLAAGLLGSMLLLRGPNPFDAVRPEDIEAHHDDVTASVSVVRDGTGGRALRIDGFEAAAADPPRGEGGGGADDPRSAYMGLMTHVPMLLHPDPRRLLVICFGTGTTAGAGLSYPAARVAVVDINPTVFAFAGHFAAANRGVAQDPRAKLIVDDGRNYLLTTRETYDVITSEPMPPRFAGVSSLYSREYYTLARERLAPGGLLAQWLPFHLVSVAEARSILRTVQDVFPEVTLWIQHGTGVIVARREAAVEVDLDGLRRRLAEPSLREDLARFRVDGHEGMLALFMLGPRGVRRAAQDAPLVTDDHPFLEFHASPYRTGRVMVGAFSADQAAALEIVYRLRGEDLLPLRASEADAAALAATRALSSHTLLGDLLVDARHWAEAQAEFEGGLALSSTPKDRAHFVAALADLDRRRAVR
jgi:spermidine synthase